RASHRESKTTDLSLGLKWQLGDLTRFSTDFQYIKADTRALDSTVSLGVDVPWIDVGLGGVPRIGIDGSFTADPANYYWGFTMENLVDNVADELAWRADIDHSFESAGFLKGFRTGVRTTQRTATNIDTGYNWQPVFQAWMAGWAAPAELPGLDLDATVNSSLVNLQTFANFYRGGASTPGAFYAPVLATALGYPASYMDIHAAATPYYLCCYGGFEEREVGGEYTNRQKEDTYAPYFMLEFGLDSALLDGNIGVRVVRTENTADGFLVYPDVPYAPYLGAGEVEPISARNAYTDVLPSLNLRWEPADNLILRFAASKAIARPDFGDMQAYQVLTGGTRDGVTEPQQGTLPIGDLELTGSSYDNPYLDPMRANQFDLSAEWYFDPDHGGMAWINLFHKDVKDYFRRQTQLVSYPGADGNAYDYLVTRPVNIGTARIQGVELGWNQFFDFLPGAFSGLG